LKDFSGLGGAYEDKPQRCGRKACSWVKYHGKRGQNQGFSSTECVGEDLRFPPRFDRATAVRCFLYACYGIPHYWDWTQDPQALTDSDGNPLNLFTSDFMGNAVGPGNTWIEIGDPWKSAGFYGGPGPYRDDPTGTPADPPQTVQRQVGVNFPLITAAQEQALLSAPDFVAFDDAMEGPSGLHNQAHGYIGGTLGFPHTSFRDPFVFLLHSNVDRLFAMWQRQPGHPERLDPTQLYKAQSTNQNGFENTKGGDRRTIDPPGVPQPGDNDVSSLRPWWGVLSPQEPWAGPGNTVQTAATGIIQNVKSVRPWAPPENQQLFKDSRDPTIVFPPHYDTSQGPIFSLRQFLLSRGFDPSQGLRHIQPPITSVRAFMHI